jgi:ribokinase
MTRVLVLGNAGVDLSLSVPRLPVPGETLVAAGGGRAPGGKGLNQAVVAARAGALVAFAAPVGDDAEAGFVEAALREERFDELRLIRLAAPTDLSVLMVAPDGENSIVTLGLCAATLPAATAAAFAGSAELGDLLVMQGNLSAAASEDAAQAAVARGARLMVNAAPLLWPQAALLGMASVFVVNAVEAEGITGLSGDAGVAALHARGADLAIVTLGAAGCVAADGAGVRRYPGHPAQAVDSSGAGDAFCGMLAAMLGLGAAVDAAIDAAQAAASLSVGRPGAFAALPTVAELAAIMGGGLASSAPVCARREDVECAALFRATTVG